MFEQLSALESEAVSAIGLTENESGLRELEVKYLGRRVPSPNLAKGMRDVPKEDRPKVGQRVNEVRRAVESAIEARQNALETAHLKALCED